MYDCRVEARMREQEYWNSAIYQKRKDRDWDRIMKMEAEWRGLKQNNEDWNVIGDLRGWLGLLEGDDIVSEVLGVSQGLGEW